MNKQLDFDIHTLLELKEVFTKLRAEMWYSADWDLMNKQLEIINQNIKDEEKRLEDLMLPDYSDPFGIGFPH